MKNLSIRNARRSDHAAIRSVTLAAYEEYATLMPPPIWAAYRQNVLETLDEEGPQECLVAVQDEVVVGSVLLYLNAAQAYGGSGNTLAGPEVRLLAVLPAARGQGIGMALMDACVQRAREAKATVLGLHTMDMMRSAQRMYERMGFVHTAERDFQPAPGMLVKGYLLHLDQDRS